MLTFEQACRRMRKHHISAIFVDYRWFAGVDGFLNGWKAGAFVFDRIAACEMVPFEGSTIEEAVDKYCTARGIKS